MGLALVIAVVMAVLGIVGEMKAASLRPAVAHVPAAVGVGAAGGAVKVAPKESKATEFWNWLTETQVWKSVFRHDRPDSDRTRVLVMLSNIFLHLHPVRIRKSGVKLR